MTVPDPEAGDGEDPPAATLADARERIADLSESDGRFVVVCKDTGVSPTPVSEATFGSYEAAERASEAAAAYRSALGELDPGLTERDLVVSETGRSSVEVASVRESTGTRRENGLPLTSRTVTVAGDRRDEWLRVENAPLVDLTGRGTRLDDEVVSRQLRSELDP